MKRSLSDIINSQKEKKAKRQSEIEATKKRIDQDFIEKEQEIEQKEEEIQAQLRKLNKEKEDILYQKSFRLQDEIDKMPPVPRCSFLKKLNYVSTHYSVFFPIDHVFPVELTELLNGNSANPGHVQVRETLLCEGVSEEEITEMIKSLKEKITITQKSAVFRLYGTVKGYKGEDTKFKPDEYDPEIPDLVSKPYEHADWSNFFNKRPLYNDIDWPDHKSTRAHAKLYHPVWLIEFTHKE